MKDLDSYVLVGDSYGAVSSIALATRQPKGLVALNGITPVSRIHATRAL